MQYIDEILVKPFLCPVTSTVIVVIAEHPYFILAIHPFPERSNDLICLVLSNSRSRYTMNDLSEAQKYLWRHLPIFKRAVFNQHQVRPMIER